VDNNILIKKHFEKIKAKIFKSLISKTNSVDGGEGYVS